MIHITYPVYPLPMNRPPGIAAGTNYTHHDEAIWVAELKAAPSLCIILFLLLIHVYLRQLPPWPLILRCLVQT